MRGELAAGPGWVWRPFPDLLQSSLPSSLWNKSKCVTCLPCLHRSSRDRRPASERSVLSPHRKSLWTDLITACGLKTAPFNSHTRVFFQAFTQTHTGRGPFPKPAFVDKSYSVRARDSRCVHSLGAAVSSMRHGVCQTRAGETGEREGGRNTREREINIAQWLNI